MTYENDLKLHEIFKRILTTMTMNERIKRPSFMIKDILGNSETTRDSGSQRNERLNTKPSLPTLPIPSSVPLPYFSYPTTPIPHGLVGLRHPGHVPFMLPRGCYPVEPFLEPRDHSFPVPIPLPVYIRTRSPMGDCFSKPKKCRRSRTVFTELQLMGLEKKFESHKYLSTPDRIELAETLGLSQIQVKTWYQNRRMKWKKVVMLKGGTEPPTKPKGRPKKNSLDIPELSHSNCSSDIVVDSDEECSDLDEEFIDITNNDQIVSSSSVDN